MAQELIYTSSPRGLKPGSSGFCTVACTEGMAPVLMQTLETYSAYKPIFQIFEANASRNPVAFSHIRYKLGNEDYSILSRTSSADADYSGRSNKIAHHIVLDETERRRFPGGPAAFIAAALRGGLFETAWRDREPEQRSIRKLNESIASLPADDLFRPPRRWESLGVDTSWAGALADRFKASPEKAFCICFDPLKDGHSGENILDLFDEAMRYLVPAERWKVTFSTYLTQSYLADKCLWKASPADSDILKSYQRIPTTLSLDLSSPSPCPEKGHLAGLAKEMKEAISERTIMELKASNPIGGGPVQDSTTEFPEDEFERRKPSLVTQKKSVAMRTAGKVMPAHSADGRGASAPPVAKRPQPQPRPQANYTIFIVAAILLIAGVLAYFIIQQRDEKDEKTETKVTVNAGKPTDKTENIPSLDNASEQGGKIGNSSHSQDSTQKDSISPQDQNQKPGEEQPNDANSEAVEEKHTNEEAKGVPTQQQRDKMQDEIKTLDKVTVNAGNPTDKTENIPSLDNASEQGGKIGNSSHSQDSTQKDSISPQDQNQKPGEEQPNDANSEAVGEKHTNEEAKRGATQQQRDKMQDEIKTLDKDFWKTWRKKVNELGEAAPCVVVICVVVISLEEASWEIAGYDAPQDCQGFSMNEAKKAIELNKVVPVDGMGGRESKPCCRITIEGVELKIKLTDEAKNAGNIKAVKKDLLSLKTLHLKNTEYPDMKETLSLEIKPPLDESEGGIAELDSKKLILHLEYKPDDIFDEYKRSDTNRDIELVVKRNDKEIKKTSQKINKEIKVELDLKKLHDDGVKIGGGDWIELNACMPEIEKIADDLERYAPKGTIERDSKNEAKTKLDNECYINFIGIVNNQQNYSQLKTLNKHESFWKDIGGKILEFYKERIGNKGTQTDEEREKREKKMSELIKKFREKVEKSDDLEKTFKEALKEFIKGLKLEIKAGGELVQEVSFKMGAKNR